MAEKSFLLCESDEECLKWWAHDLNDTSLYQTVRTKAQKCVFWRCPICDTVFERVIYSMVTPYAPQCPACSEKQEAERKQNIKILENTPVSSFPELLSAWDDERDPTTVMFIPKLSTNSYEDRVFRFKCSFGHHSWLSPSTYLSRGCPYCNSRKNTEPGKGYIVDEWPELAAEWAFTNDSKFTPHNTRHNSTRMIAWKCIACSYEWSETPKDRTRTYSACCPNCKKILGSLGWKYPEIAKEWDADNELSAWQVRKQTYFVPSWVCTKHPEHKWKTNIINRINGATCPFCAEKSKSRTELMYFDAAKKYFSDVKSGVELSNPVFSHTWTVDMLISSTNKIVVEYDGAYWHSRKILQDTKKSLELLNADYWVIRLRETGLISLDISDAKYHEIVVNPLSPKADNVMEQIKNFINNTGVQHDSL